MKKQELIKHIEDLPYNEGLIVDTIKISRNGLLKLIEQLDESEKVKVPQCVHKYIQESKEYNWDLQDLMKFIDDEDSEELQRWFYHECNQETLARAWLDGYEIQRTKYVVTDGNHLYFKNYQEDIEIVILVDEQPGTMEYVKKFNTKEEAQKAADILGWKVQEVKDETL